MKSLNKNAYLLLGCLLLNNITSIFIYTYLLAFILNISANGIMNNQIVDIICLSLVVAVVGVYMLHTTKMKKCNKKANQS